MFDSRDPKCDLDPPFTKGDAEAVAVRLLGLPGVIRIEVCGEIARVGYSSEMDIIVVVDDECLHKSFISNTRYIILDQTEFCSDLFDRPSPGKSGWRRTALARTFGSAVFWRTMNPFKEPTFRSEALGLMDILVMPRDWKERLDELQSHLHHDDPSFLRNIAKDAQVLVAKG